MTSIDFKDAVIRLYEDYSLTEGYDDEQAGVVHAWAEGQLQIHANTAQDEAEFEQFEIDMTRVLKMVNRFIVKRGEMDETKQRRFMELFIERAEQGGFPVEMRSAGEFYQVVQGLDDISTIRAFLGFVETGLTDVSATPPAPPRTAPYANLPETAHPQTVPSDDDVTIIDSTSSQPSLRDTVQSKLSSIKSKINDAPLPEDVIETTAEVIDAVVENLPSDHDTPDSKNRDEEKDAQEGDKQSKWGLFNLLKPSNDDDN